MAPRGDDEDFFGYDLSPIVEWNGGSENLAKEALRDAKYSNKKDDPAPPQISTTVSFWKFNSVNCL